MGATAAVPESAHQQPHTSSVPSVSADPSQQDKQPSSSGSQPPYLPFPKDCRACAGAQHMIKTFQKLTSTQAGGAGLSTSSTHPLPSPSPNHRPPSSLLPPAAALAAATAAAVDAGHADATAAQPAAQPALPCPPETSELGTATWTFLHTMAAYYPDQPTGAQRSLMRSMMEGLAEFYPCSICAEHLQQQIQDSPPDVASASALSLWLCKIHNEVNEMLGKPTFDCSRVLERWRDGPADGSCG